MGDGGADAGQEQQPGAENAGRGAVCCHLTFQTLLQPVRMAHPAIVGRQCIFRMQVAEGCAVCSPGVLKIFDLHSCLNSFFNLYNLLKSYRKVRVNLAVRVPHILLSKKIRSLLLRFKIFVRFVFNAKYHH